MMIYNVPEEIRKKKIDKVLAMDYLSIGKKVLEAFITYTEQATEAALEEVLKTKTRK